ncbi:MAG TPA: histidine kinase [Steroidobacteraceae bacterium]|jgi:signal transduction histidine kinase|nr:histidine kinase [Steroidobacteraceae bacterium]
MNTVAFALPGPRSLLRDRIRGLYNGVGYAAAAAALMTLWDSLQLALPRLIAGDIHGFIVKFGLLLGWSAASMIPGPLLVPVVVNLAPRTGPSRVLWLLAAVIPMSWWCERVIGRIHFGWDWQSLGYALDGLLTTGLVVGVCAWHSYSRAAADTLMRMQLDRAGLDAELKRAQLQLLRTQIEPHFLFNTLSVVRALARSDQAATVAMLDNLIRYFEAALPRLRQSEVPLAQEMELVTAYLAIYRARMGTRLAYEVDLPADLRQLRVPPMMLLTLVENALKHGVSPTVEGGFIRVSATCERNSLLLRVADSGRGLDARHGHGTGLANICQRLLMMYGPQAVLSLKAAEPRGMVASITVPVH